MDQKQLQLLASRVRNLLENSGHSIGHNQSLDLIAALPGLRSWPEVRSFPNRVSAFELDLVSAGRLAHRLIKKFGVDFSVPSLMTVLDPTIAENHIPTTEIWPAGPAPGVYVTTSQAAIDKLLENYDDATDGALVYAERAGSSRSAIDLGEYGLWSPGLSRVQSGTLLVVGPLQLDQQSWGDSSERLEMSCQLAQSSGHRIAVLLQTPTPESICEDAQLMVRSIQAKGDNSGAALLGIVTEHGELQRRAPFAKARPSLAHKPCSAKADAIPPAALAALHKAVANRTAGLLIFGSEVYDEHPGIEYVTAALAITDHAGPAARIMPRQRGTPTKDWHVPDPIKGLPFLPSIESAYDQGYRRMIFSPGFTEEKTLLKFGRHALLIAGTFEFDVASSFMRIASHSYESAGELLQQLIAILGVLPIRSRSGVAVASDLFVMPEERAIKPMKYEDTVNYLEANRTLKWQEEIADLLDTRTVTVSAVKKAAGRNYRIKEFLAGREMDRKNANTAQAGPSEHPLIH